MMAGRRDNEQILIQKATVMNSGIQSLHKIASLDSLDLASKGTLPQGSTFCPQDVQCQYHEKNFRSTLAWNRPFVEREETKVQLHGVHQNPGLGFPTQSLSQPTSPLSTRKFGCQASVCKTQVHCTTTVQSSPEPVNIPIRKYFYMPHGYILLSPVSPFAPVYDPVDKNTFESSTITSSRAEVYDFEYHGLHTSPQNMNCQNSNTLFAYPNVWPPGDTHLEVDEENNEMQKNYVPLSPKSPVPVRYVPSPVRCESTYSSRSDSSGHPCKLSPLPGRSRPRNIPYNEDVQPLLYPNTSYNKATPHSSRSASPSIFHPYSSSHRSPASSEYEHLSWHSSGNCRRRHSDIQGGSSEYHLKPQDMRKLSSPSNTSIPVIHLSHSYNSDDTQSNISSLHSSSCQCSQCIDSISPPSPQKSPRKNWSLRKFLLDRMLASSPHSSLGSTASMGSRGSIGDM
ncbi:uncharacterized protein LOC135198754 [Macrobrachium nipponense]|uniref:uncharacterized protein LOC135198754 n=1 Tax=Macrobrachium nipponense TaxID=159736 RepID=UPI0030C83C3C